MDSRIQLAAAALALAAAGAVSAQSNVTVFGLIELQAGRQTQQAPGAKLFDMVGSRIGFKGEEDLGGGLKASFYLEHRLDPDTGTVNGGPTFWKGGSWVGVSGKDIGSVKLGRWWSQSFLKAQYAADPFEMNTLGQAFFGTVGCGPNYSGGCLGAFWVNNSVTYENSVGGFSFGVQASVEQVGTTDKKRPANVGLSYGDGPLYIAVGHEVSNSGDKDQDWTSFALNYDLKLVKLYLGYGTGHDDSAKSRKNTVVGFRAPVGGAGTIVGSLNAQEQDGRKVQQLLSLGYEYKLSKRTKVFGVLASDDKAATGLNKSGYALGMNHSF